MDHAENAMKLDTIAVHGRSPERGRRPGEPVVVPIHQTSNFHLGEDEYRLITAGRTREANLYTRLGNPTLRSAADKFAAMHGAERGEIYASGMGAISSVLLTFLGAGDSLVTSLDMYGGTVDLLHRVAVRAGIEVINTDPADAGRVAAAIRPSTKVMFFETLSNPLLKVPDMEGIVGIARQRDMVLVIDNTFASPVNFRPLEHGAGIVVESSTKYLAGHSDCIGGFAAGSDRLMRRVWKTGTLLGASADPFAAFLADRGMKTLALRMERHNANALALARFLEGHRAVRTVIHPGLPSHPDHERARGLLDGFGGMVSFVLEGGNEAGLRLMKRLRFFIEATSLGGVESLLEMPFNTSHAPLTDEERAEAGIVPGFMRMSVGIEDGEDLIGDLEAALDQSQ
jgi:cystathionine beta-lyase/cystathionine gamma-synthase